MFYLYEPSLVSDSPSSLSLLHYMNPYRQTVRHRMKFSRGSIIFPLTFIYFNWIKLTFDTRYLGYYTFRMIGNYPWRPQSHSSSWPIIARHQYQHISRSLYFGRGYMRSFNLVASKLSPSIGNIETIIIVSLNKTEKVFSLQARA